MSAAVPSLWLWPLWDLSQCSSIHPALGSSPCPGVPLLTSDPKVQKGSSLLLPTAFDPALPSLAPNGIPCQLFLGKTS